MSELQQYYDNFCRAYWADPDPDVCLCRGTGWALSDVDTTHKCPHHYKGQPDPSFEDDPEVVDARNNHGQDDIADLIALDPREGFSCEEEECPF